MKHKAVIGLGFGDEGKGLVTNYLCQQDYLATVVRFSGGQQAGHTVVKNDFRHVFSNFGSGTLNGNMTYWSKYCTFDPISFVNEYKILREYLYNPLIEIDDQCPVTTPYEKHFLGNSINHGTCGVGVGQTWERENNHISLFFKDLFDPIILKIKLDLIEKYYNCSLDLSEFFKAIEFIIWNMNTPTRGEKLPENVNLIFEGSQGLLLDQNIGFFPHVTRSNTGSKNIFEMGYTPEFFMVTRAYQTRHGNGPMTNIELEHNIKLNSKETNVFNEFQGNFQVSLLDLNLLKYGLEKDSILSKNRDNLVITCLDHIQDNYKLTLNEKIKSFSSEEDFIGFIANYLNFNSVYISHSDKSEELKKFIW